jgi:hypothetical protein
MISYTRVKRTEENPNIKEYVFISESELDDVGALCDQFEEEHINRVLPGEALLVDLRGEKPRFESVPIDYRLPNTGERG